VHDFLQDLNQNQKSAVEFIDGASLVIAGAGSGKTRVLTYKIAYLLELGFKPYSILALTFTNKAAAEMKNRIAKLIGDDKAHSIWMGTFHSIFAKILRIESAFLGYPASYTIYDTIDSKSVLRGIIKDLKLDDKQYPINEIYGRISNAKNNLITSSIYINDSDIQKVDYNMKRPEIGRIYQMYSQRCFKAQAMDFDDLLVNTNILFRDFPDILKKYQNKFSFLLVDEYQDTNYSQYLIVKKLAEKHQLVCVVGDDAQSIYSFRGAKIENILNFQKDYPDYKLFKLEQNYRSTKNIVDAANSIIEKNEKRIPKNLFSNNEEGSKIKIIEAKTDTEEGYIVTNEIIDSQFSNQFHYQDFAVLYRTNAQSRIIEEALRKRNIPYKIYGGTSFYQRKEIKDILAYFRLVVNHSDDESLKRIINYPRRGIGDTTLEKVSEYANISNKSLWEVLKIINHIEIDLNSRAINSLLGFVNLIEDFSSKLQFMNAYGLGNEIAVNSGIIKDLYTDKTPEGVSRFENIQELINGLKEFTDQEDIAEEDKTLSNYLQEIALLTNQDNEKSEDKNKVSLMTIHSAKGLEFKQVFIVGTEEGLFPSVMSSSSQKEIEEERRLFYVAVTRAEKKLIICYSKLRYKWGQLATTQQSRFIKEIDPKFLELPLKEKETGFEEKFDNSLQNSIFAKDKNYINFNKFKKEAIAEEKPQSIYQGYRHSETSKLQKLTTAETKNNHPEINNQNNNLQIGANVEHSRFGIGKVVSVEGVSPNTKATIEFAVVGIKQLLLKFAKLKILD
jgi:DNA helicase-2/ATP-dependent DNA helicase PcrA